MPSALTRRLVCAVHGAFVARCTCRAGGSCAHTRAVTVRHSLVIACPVIMLKARVAWSLMINRLSANPPLLEPNKHSRCFLTTCHTIWTWSRHSAVSSCAYLRGLPRVTRGALAGRGMHMLKGGEHVLA